MRWHAPDGLQIGSPAVLAPLLEQAIAAQPVNGLLHAKLGYLYLDQYDFGAASLHLERAVQLDPEAERPRTCLARCHNMLGRHREAIGALGETGSPHYERALAFQGLGREADAEREYRAILAADPNHRHACRKLNQILRRAGRVAEWLEVCEALSAAGASHSQLLQDWGAALALTGEPGKAGKLLCRCDRITQLDLPVPAGFGTIEAFNEALAEEILGNPHRVSDLPSDEANRGSSRVEKIFAGARPDLIHLLLGGLQEIVSAHAPAMRGDFDPWVGARPDDAHLKAWGLIQRGDDYETWHIHRGGWLSGVYYVRVPACVSLVGEGRGCIEFGPPQSVQRQLPDVFPLCRIEPRAGTLLLAPSHYAHRTIPMGVDEHRISFAFDVVPEALAG